MATKQGDEGVQVEHGASSEEVVAGAVWTDLLAGRKGDQSATGEAKRVPNERRQQHDSIHDNVYATRNMRRMCSGQPKCPRWPVAHGVTVSWC